MAVERLDEIKQQANSLTVDEKLNLAAYLVEQAQRDKAAVSDSQRARDESTEPDPYRRQEYEWLRQHRDAYAGQYVALYGDRLVAHGADGRAVLREAREAGFPRALMVRIEAPGELPFAGW
jgi:hypothetical protein